MGRRSKAKAGRPAAEEERYYGGAAAAPGATLCMPPLRRRKRPLAAAWETGAGTCSIAGALDAAECAALVAAATAYGFSHQSSRGPAYGEARRQHLRCAFDDAASVSALWGRLRDVCRDALPSIGGLVPVGLNQNVRMYAYQPSDHFGAHYDQSVKVHDGLRTEYTLLVYLSGDMAGGETVFYDKREREIARIVPAEGAALLFRHGDECLMHEAMPVRSGTKHVLRTDVIYGPA
jgi:hypothetical protein